MRQASLPGPVPGSSQLPKHPAQTRCPPGGRGPQALVDVPPLVCPAATRLTPHSCRLAAPAPSLEQLRGTHQAGPGPDPKPPVGAQPRAAPSPSPLPQQPRPYPLFSWPLPAHPVRMEAPSAPAPLPSLSARHGVFERRRRGEGQRRGWRLPTAPGGAWGPSTGCFSNLTVGPSSDPGPLLFSHCCSWGWWPPSAWASTLSSLRLTWSACAAAGRTRPCRPSGGTPAVSPGRRWRPGSSAGECPYALGSVCDLEGGGSLVPTIGGNQEYSGPDHQGLPGGQPGL